MIQIKNPAALDKIVKNLFKKKRSVPRYMMISPEYNTINIRWRNNRWTKIVDIFISIDIETYKGGDMYGVMTVVPKKKVEKQYQLTTFVFDITNFRKSEVV